jgi:anthranilate synthase/aminodeoxychorismate synthase-like glutamine amidotransferase
MILLIDNYDSFTYNLYQMVQAQTSQTVRVVRNDAATYTELMAGDDRPSRIILSPGPGHPDTPTDFGVCAELIDRHAEHGLPLLGVCLGHQGLGSRFGASVIQAPCLMHGKPSPVRILKESPLLAGLPNPFMAMRYHSLVIDEATLPTDTFEVLAKDDDHGLIMAVAHKTAPLYGVQFHPESIGTPEGARLLANFLGL